MIKGKGMVKKKNIEKEKTEKELLEEIKDKLEVITLLLSLQGKTERGKYKILRNFAKTSKLSKREIERITAIDRHEF